MKLNVFSTAVPGCILSSVGNFVHLIFCNFLFSEIRLLNFDQAIKMYSPAELYILEREFTRLDFGAVGQQSHPGEKKELVLIF